MPDDGVDSEITPKRRTEEAAKNEWFWYNEPNGFTLLSFIFELKIYD